MKKDLRMFVLFVSEPGEACLRAVKLWYIDSSLIFLDFPLLTNRTWSSYSIKNKRWEFFFL